MKGTFMYMERSYLQDCVIQCTVIIAVDEYAWTAR